MTHTLWAAGDKILCRPEGPPNVEFQEVQGLDGIWRQTGKAIWKPLVVQVTRPVPAAQDIRLTCEYDLPTGKRVEEWEFRNCTVENLVGKVKLTFDEAHLKRTPA